jgi:hypothetical protein
MTEEQPRRKPRVPLSPEELYYFKQIKKLKNREKEDAFKATFFYKALNRTNIFFAGFLTYAILSTLILCSWEESQITRQVSSFGALEKETQRHTISAVDLTLNTGEEIHVKTDGLFEQPKNGQLIHIGRDLLFNKIIKVKFAFDDRAFWNTNTYASLSLCIFAMVLGLFIYKVNKHLSVNGLLMALCLFSLASLYFVMV